MMIFLASAGIAAFQAIPGGSSGKFNDSPALAASDIGGTNGTELVADEEALYGNGTLPELESYGESSSEGIPPASNPASYEYPATYSFANDEVGYNPAGWIINESPDTDIQVVTSYKDSLNWTHGSVLLINNTNSTADSARNNFTSDQSCGTIEFYAAFGEVIKNHAIKIINTDGDPAIEIVFNNDGHIRAKSGSIWKDARYGPLDYEASEFTHIHLEFECWTSQYEDLRPNNPLFPYMYNLFVNTQLAFADFDMSATTGNMAAIEFSQSEINSVAYYDAVDYSWDSGHNNVTVDGANMLIGTVEDFEGFNVNANITTSSAWSAEAGNDWDGTTIIHDIQAQDGSNALHLKDDSVSKGINITRVLGAELPTGDTLRLDFKPLANATAGSALYIAVREGTANRVRLQVNLVTGTVSSSNGNTFVDSGRDVIIGSWQSLEIELTSSTTHRIRVASGSWSAILANNESFYDHVSQINFQSMDGSKIEAYIDDIDYTWDPGHVNTRNEMVEDFECFDENANVTTSSAWSAETGDGWDGTDILHDIKTEDGSKTLHLKDNSTSKGINVTRVLGAELYTGYTLRLDLKPLNSTTPGNAIYIAVREGAANRVWLLVNLTTGAIYSSNGSTFVGSGRAVTFESWQSLEIELTSSTTHRIRVASGTWSAVFTNNGTITSHVSQINFQSMDGSKIEAYIDNIDYSRLTNMFIGTVEDFEGFDENASVTTSSAWSAEAGNDWDGTTIVHDIQAQDGSKALHLKDDSTSKGINITRVLGIDLPTGDTLRLDLKPMSSVTSGSALYIAVREGTANRVRLQVNLVTGTISSSNGNTFVDSGTTVTLGSWQSLEIELINSTTHRIRVASGSWSAVLANNGTIASHVSQINFQSMDGSKFEAYIDDIDYSWDTGHADMLISMVEDFEGFSENANITTSSAWSAETGNDWDGTTIVHDIQVQNGSKTLHLKDESTSMGINITRVLGADLSTGNILYLDLKPMSSATSGSALYITVREGVANRVRLRVNLVNGTIYSSNGSTFLDSGKNVTLESWQSLEIELTSSTTHRIRVASGSWSAVLANNETFFCHVSQVNFQSMDGSKIDAYVDNICTNNYIFDSLVIHDITVTNDGNLTITNTDTYLLVNGYVQVAAGCMVSVANGATLDCRDGLSWASMMQPQDYLTKDISCVGNGSTESVLTVDDATLLSDGIEASNAQVEFTDAVVHVTGFRFAANNYEDDPGEDLVITSSMVTCDNHFHPHLINGVAVKFSGTENHPTVIDTPSMAFGSGQSYNHDGNGATLEKCTKVTIDHANFTGMLFFDFSYEVTIDRCNITELIITESPTIDARNYSSISVTHSHVGLYSPNIIKGPSAQGLILRPYSGTPQFSAGDVYRYFEVVEDETSGARAHKVTWSGSAWVGDFFELNATFDAYSTIDIVKPSAFAFGPKVFDGASTNRIVVKDCATKETMLLSVGHVDIMNTTLSVISSEAPENRYSVANCEFYNAKDLDWSNSSNVSFYPDGLGWIGNANIHAFAVGGFTSPSNAEIRFINCWFPPEFTAYHGTPLLLYDSYINPSCNHTYLFIDTNFVLSETNIDFCICTNPRFNCMIMNTTKGAPVSIDYFMFRKEHYSGFDIENGDFPGPGPVDCELMMPDNCYSSSFVVKVKNSTGATIETVTVNAPSRTFTLDDMTTCDDFTISFSVTGDSTQYPVAGILHNYFRDD
nr:hypothetical protein [Candidatus Sigynarchaeota archaeon]